MLLLVFVFCGPKSSKVEKTIENGVEVVLNHLEPYKIKGGPTSLFLEEEFRIDSEKDEIVELGLTDIWYWFDVDSEGNIYLLDFRGTSEFWIFKFDKSGNSLTSFGRRGQGPGEFQRPGMIRVTNEDELAVVDMNRKLSLLDRKGAVIKEIPLSSNNGVLIPLNANRYLMSESIQYPSEDISSRISLYLCNEDLQKLKEMVSMETPNPLKTNRLMGVPTVPIFSITDKSFFLWDPKRGYEISEYDFEGKLLRKIRKEYIPVEVSEEYKKGFLKMYERPGLEIYRKIAYFPKHLPPFQLFFADDTGYLFVMTYEKGSTPRERFYDIFNENGVFIARTRLENISIQDLREYPLNVMTLNGRLYCLREKDNGYKELVVYKMIWEN